MNNLAAKLRNSVSKSAIAASRVNKKRTDADADTVASRLTKESRGRIGKRDTVDVDKLGAKLAKMPKVDQKTIRAVEARLSPVEAGQLARVRDAKPVAASAAARAVTKANTPPSAASLKMITSVEAGELARRGGDVAAYAAAKQSLTPVQKGEYARMLDTQATGVRALTRSTVNPALNPTLNPTNVSAAVAASNLTATTTNPLAQPAFGTKGSIADLSVRALKAADSIATDGVQPFAINSEGVGANGELRPQSRSFFSDVGDAVKDFGKDVGDAFKELGNTIVEGVEGIADVFNGGGSGGDNGPEQSLGEFITTLPQVAFDSLGSAANFLSVSPVWVAKDLVEGFDEFIVGPVADAANAARDRIVAAFEGTTRLLTDLVSGEAAKNFLAYAGTGTEWGEHMVNLLTDPSGATGFAEGFARGVGESVLDMATQVGKMAQLIGDASFFGRAGDAVRDWAGEDNLPPWLNEAIPSEERGEETIQATYDSLVNLGNYISSRAQDPRLLLDDFKNYFGDKWESLKGEWEAAHAAGPRAEGEFFGKIAGKALFEIALNFVPGKAVLTVANAAEKFTDFAGTIKKLPDGKLPSEKLPELNTHLDDLQASADRVATSGYATDEELASLENAWEELNSLPPETLGSSPEAIATSEKANEVQNDLADAINKVRLSTPNPNVAPGTLPDVRLSTGASDLKDDFETQAIQNPPNTPTRITVSGNSNIPALTKDLANLTDESGVEYAMFRKPNGTGSDDIILYRGDENNIDFDQSELQQLAAQGYELYAHTHVSGRGDGAIYSDPNLVASTDDQDILKALGQTNDSLIISSDGRTARFDANNTSIAGSNGHVDHTVFTNEAQFNRAANAPAANRAYKSYEYNGYTYQTDSKGRVVSASGELNTNPPNTPRQNASLQTKIGHEGRPKRANNEYPDVGFHLIGHQFGGGINRLNVVPGDKFLNGTRNAAPGSGYSKANDYGNLEKRWSDFKAANPNNRIMVDIRPVYDDLNGEGITDRPSAFEIHWSEYDANTNTWTNYHDYRPNEVPEDVVL